MNVSNIFNKLSKLSHVDVFVVGDVILDEYVEGQVLRISPEAPVPVLRAKGKRQVLGGAANCAANCAATGANVWLSGRIGSDAAGEQLKQLCQDRGIEIKTLVCQADAPTTLKTRIIAGGHEQLFPGGFHQLLRIDNEVTEPLNAAQCEEVLQGFRAFKNHSTHHKALVISDYAKGVFNPVLVQELIQLAQESSIPVITDPKSKNLSLYRGSTVIKPNLKESLDAWKAQDMGELPSDFKEKVSCLADNLLKHAGVQNVVMSLSEYGCYGVGESFQKPYHAQTVAQKVVDVSGAGDTLIAWMACSLAAQFSIEEAVYLGNYAAGLSCNQAGTAVISCEDLRESTHVGSGQGDLPVERKIVTLQEAKKLSESLRRKGRQIVFTNGCFDIIHAGHIHVLHQSKGQGDVMFLGLNSDSSVRGLKGPSRPIQEEKNRAKVLAALEAIDYICIFDQDTPLELIKAIQPDILVKGGDYTLDTIVGAKEVQSYGGRVVTIPLVDGLSTTNIVEKSKK